MALIVVGGQSKDVGKTTLICNIIRAFPAIKWNAAKITNHEHKVVGCSLVERRESWSIWEQLSPTDPSDTSRFLQAGARRSFLVQAVEVSNEIADAIAAILGHEQNLIVESNHARGFASPDLFLLLLDSAQQEIKPSAKENFDRADALVWRGVPPRKLPRGLSLKPCFQAHERELDSKLKSLIAKTLAIAERP